MMIITDNWDSYNQATTLNSPNSIHHTYSTFSDDLNNNFMNPLIKLLKLGIKPKKALKTLNQLLLLLQHLFIIIIFYTNILL